VMAMTPVTRASSPCPENTGAAAISASERRRVISRMNADAGWPV